LSTPLFGPKPQRSEIIHRKDVVKLEQAAHAVSSQVQVPVGSAYGRANVPPPSNGPVPESINAQANNDSAANANVPALTSISASVLPSANYSAHANLLALLAKANLLSLANLPNQTNEPRPAPLANANIPPAANVVNPAQDLETVLADSLKFLDMDVLAKCTGNQFAQNRGGKRKPGRLVVGVLADMLLCYFYCYFSSFSLFVFCMFGFGFYCSGFIVCCSITDGFC